MNNKKTLLVSGCSFTFEPWNWPTFVCSEMDYNLINVGMASSGNGLIGKKVIYQVDKLLKTQQPEDIIVGVMWSGVDRHDFYTDDSTRLSNINGWIENPTNVVDNRKNWVITNYAWDIPQAKNWYQNLHTHVGSMIMTIHNILMVQWYLERKGVKYFMSTYMDIFHSSGYKDLIVHPEVKYLFDMVDFSKFLPVSGCHEWVKENYNEFGFSGHVGYEHRGIHPTEFGHIKFAEEVVVPFIKQNLL
jgi:hypothetical protein